MRWTEIRLEKSGRKGWDLVLPRFEDDDGQDNAKRMNLFYNTAAAEMEKAAALAAQTDARRVRYRCETEVRVLEELPNVPKPDKPDKPDKRGLFFRRPYFRKREMPMPKERVRAGDVRVSLRLTLAVSGQWTREKTLVHLWRDGVLLSSRVLL